MTRILIADDEHAVRQLLELVLREQGYEVLPAKNGDQLIQMAQDYIPDLLLIDPMMPGIDGYEAIRQLRNDTRTAHLPMVILTARATPNDVVVGFDTGADDYIIKPFNVTELTARIRGHLRRAAQKPVRNALTDLPGNTLIIEEVKFRLRRDEPFALLYIDIDNFKSFNDTYGFARGDQMIKVLADALVTVVQQHGGPDDFIGHIGGDDFAVLTIPERVDTLTSHLTTTFQQRIRSLYDAEDFERGYLDSLDRNGIPRQFSITTLSIGVVINDNGQFTDHDAMSRVAAEVKKFAKQHPGNYIAFNHRRAGKERVDNDRRGKNLAAIVVASADPHLRKQVMASIQVLPYRVLPATDMVAVHQVLAREPMAQLIIADMRLGEALWSFREAARRDMPEIKWMLLANSNESLFQTQPVSNDVIVHVPLSSWRMLLSTARLMRRGGEQ